MLDFGTTRGASSLASTQIRVCHDSHGQNQRIYSTTFPGITYESELREIDTVMLEDFLPQFVQKVVQEHNTECLNKIARVSEEKWFTLVSSLLREDFLHCIWEILTTSPDPAIVKDAITIIGNMWWASSDEPVFRTEIAQALVTRMEQGHHIILCARALNNFASQSRTNADALISFKTPEVIASVWSADLKSDKAFLLDLISSVYNNIDPVMAPALNCVVPLIITSIPSRYSNCRISALNAVLRAFSAPDAYRCLLDNGLVAAIHRAMNLVDERQAGPMYSVIHFIIERDGPGVMASDVFFEKISRAIDEDKAEYISNPELYPVLCSVIRMMMYTFHEEMDRVGVVARLAGLAANGKAGMRMETATALAVFLEVAPAERVREVLDQFSLDLLLDVVSEVAPEHMLIILTCMLRLARDNIIEIDCSIVSILESLREQEISQECDKTIALLLTAP